MINRPASHSRRIITEIKSRGFTVSSPTCDIGVVGVVSFVFIGVSHICRTNWFSDINSRLLPGRRYKLSVYYRERPFSLPRKRRRFVLKHQRRCTALGSRGPRSFEVSNSNQVEVLTQTTNGFLAGMLFFYF